MPTDDTVNECSQHDPYTYLLLQMRDLAAEAGSASCSDARRAELDTQLQRLKVQLDVIEQNDSQGIN